MDLISALPSATPPEIVKMVDGPLREAMSDPAVLEHIRATGLEPTTTMGEGEARRKWLAADRDTRQKVIRDNHIKPE